MNNDKKNKTIAWLVSVGVQVLMLVLFYFLVVWEEPYPPIPTYGIELGFGVVDKGGGRPKSSPKEEVKPDIPEEVEEVSDEPIEEIVEEVVEETQTEAAEEVVTTENINDVSATEEIEEIPEVPDPVVEEKKTEIKEEALMPTTSNQDGTGGDGDNKDKTGDQGKEEGKIDGRALYGSQGNGEGASLNMAGWEWDEKPKPQDNSNESGKIVYKIILDSEGYITRIDLISSTVSPAVERIYRQSVDRLTFSKNNEYKPAPTSEGTVTFIIKTN